MSRATVVTLLTLSLVALPAFGRPESPTPVSPGSVSKVERVEDRCPTFSWGGSDAASGYALVAYRLTPSGQSETPVLHRAFPPSVSSWTPSLELCFEPGGRYAWSVGAMSKSGEVSWSPPSFFSVAAGTSRADFERALVLVRDYLDRQESSIDDADGKQISAALEVNDGFLDGFATPETALPTAAALSVDGGVEATAFGGDGSALTNLDPTQLSAAVALDRGGTGATDAAGARTNLGVAAQADFTAHTGDASAHHEQTVDTTCDGAACDGTLFTNLDPAQLSAAVALDRGGTGATDAAGARTNLGVAAQADFTTHTGNASAHHLQTVDTTCTGAACDGTLFTNLQWANIADTPPGLDDGDDDTTYGAGPGLTLIANTFSLATERTSAPLANQVSTVESPGSTGYNPSITIGVDGLPVIAYLDFGSGVKVAKCNDPACAGGDETITVLDGDGSDPSITIGTDGFPIVSYRSETAQDLWVAKCNDAACAGGDETYSVVDDSTYSVGSGSIIIIGSDGRPVICYNDSTLSRMKVAKCNDAACSGGDETLSYPDPTASSNYCGGMTLAIDGLPLISYRRNPGSGLWVAKCNDHACAGEDETLSLVDEGGGAGKMTLGSDGFPIISYGEAGELKVAKCNDIACTGSDEMVSVVDPTCSSNPDTAIVLNDDGLPTIFYSHWASSTLKVVKCNDEACSGADETPRTLASDWTVELSGTLGADRLPIAAYLKGSVYDLRVAHCGSEFCVPYFRR